MLDIKDRFEEAYICQQSGRLMVAAQLYQEILKEYPEHIETLFLLGTINFQQGDTSRAIELLQRVIQLKPDHAEAHNNLGNAFLRQRRLKEAVASYEQALSLRPDIAEAHNNYSVALRGLARLDEAAQCLKRALELKPGYVEAYNNLGAVLIDQARFEEAVGCIKKALELKPDHVEALNNLGVALKRQGKLDEALAAFKQAFAIRPDYSMAYNNMGTILRDQGKLEDAVASYARALALKPDYVEAINNLGIALRDQGMLDHAIMCYDKALGLEPDHVEVIWNRAIACLLKGDYAKGWPGYEMRFIRKEPPPRLFSQPRWNGSPFPGLTLLVHAEQGIGDTFQFVRFLPFVKELGGKVIFECQQRLSGLLGRCYGFDEIIERTDDGKPTARFDIYAPLLSLPGLLGIRLNTIPGDVPYIRPDPVLVEKWRRRLVAAICNRKMGDKFGHSDRSEDQDLNSMFHPLYPVISMPDPQPPLSNPFKIGLVWAGNPAHRNDFNRSCPLSFFAPLGRVQGLMLFGLQKGHAAREVVNLPDGMRVLNMGDEMRDFMDTAAVIANLDLVISVDTAVAHLAGALGKPIWTILPFSPDWRWLLGRDDSPWYPTMRLFRQPKPGDWDSVIQCVTKELLE